MIQLKLDKQTLRQAEKLAAGRKLTLEELLQEIIATLAKPADPFRGLFRDEPEVLDRIVEEAMSARETQPLIRRGHSTHMRRRTPLASSHQQLLCQIHLRWHKV